MKMVLLAFYLFITIWSLISIIFHGSRPTKSISWVLAVLALPLAGPLLYYLFGVNRRKFKLFKLKQTERRKLYDSRIQELNDYEQFIEDFDSQKNARLSQLVKSNSLTSAYSGNQVTLLNSGDETFEAIFESIGNAKKFIHLQYFIIEEGAIVDRLFALLKEKIQEGLEVRMIYDSLGSFSFRGKAIERFRHIGVKAHSIMPLRFGNLLFTLNYRNHRKIIIVDGNIGFTGGVNISDRYIKPEDHLGIWNDFHLKIEGPVVNSLHRIFIKDYHFSGDEKLLLQKKYLPDISSRGDSVVQMVISGPDSKHPAIMQQYVTMINLAEKSIYIANPYFIPGIPVLEALKMAAMSGVEVNLLVPKKSDSLIARLSMFSNFENLLATGVNIYLRSDFSHSKVIVIDQEIASVGSGNFDYRSFEHNFEANALLYDRILAGRITDEFILNCSDAICLEYESFKRRSSWRKFCEGLAKFFSPLL
ncbi:cardiolipin synthase [Maribacter sp.]